MDKITNNVLCAVYLEQQSNKILEKDNKQRAWLEVDKTKLPISCFLWIGNSDRKSTWHLPYREGSGGIDPQTKLYRAAGPVNLDALKAINQTMDSRSSGSGLRVPSSIKSKIRRMLKKYDIIQSAKNQGDSDMEIMEATIDKQFVEMNLDKENRVIANVSVLRPTSSNSYIKGTKGTIFSEQALRDTARLINGRKFYLDHASESEDRDNRGVRKQGDMAGYFENGRLDNNHVVRADIRYLKTNAERLEDIVENMADKIGLSIHAFGPMILDRDKNMGITESMSKVASADLVTETGSTINLFESQQSEETEEDEEMDYEKINLTELKESRPDIIEAVEKGVKESMQNDDELKAQKESNVTLQKENADLKKKVDDSAVVEAKREREGKILELIEASDLKDKKEVVTPLFMESLRGAKDEAGIKALIEDRVKLIKESTAGVKNMGDEGEGDEKPLTKEVLEAEKAKYKEALK